MAKSTKAPKVRSALEQTVAALERRVAELERAAAVSATAPRPDAPAPEGGGTVEPSEVVRAHRFELFDAKRRMRGVFSACGAAGEPSLTLADAGGRPRLDLSLDLDGTPTVHLYDGDGRPTATLRGQALTLKDKETHRTVRLAADEGSATLRFADKRGDVRAVLGVLGDTEDEAPLMCLEPAPGEGGAALHIESDGFELVDPRDGSPRARLRVFNSKNPVFALFRADDTGDPAPGLVLGVHGEGEPAVELHHANGAVAASVAVAPDGTPEVALKTPAGTRSTSLTGAGRNGAEVLFWRDDGSVAATFGLSRGGKPHLQLLDQNSRERVRVAMDGVSEFLPE